MDEADYGGVRISLNGILDTMQIPLKIDISTGDIITPAAIHYHYKLMFEEREILLWAYNLETVLAEKIETVLSRSTANTRLRDFYDIYILQQVEPTIEIKTLAEALVATCHKRASKHILSQYAIILKEIEKNTTMKNAWKRYQQKNSYASDIEWEIIMNAVFFLCNTAIP